MSEERFEAMLTLPPPELVEEIEGMSILLSPELIEEMENTKDPKPEF